MKLSKTAMIPFLMAFLILLGVPLARAIRPLYAPFATAAGVQFTAGYKDGSFNTALFNQPLGLTVSDDGTRLFVADSGNNRIRVVHLDQDNEVGTIAGQGEMGNSDGPVTSAQFHEPRGVLYLPGDYLAVNDSGNQSLRFVDLKAGTVTTYRGGPVQEDGSAPLTSSPKQPVLLSGIKDMAYLPTAHSILFTQPEAGVLSELDLGTGQIKAVLKGSAQLPHPSALWVQDNKIYVADRDLQSVYSMDWATNAVTNLQPAGNPVDKVLSLTFSDNTLYGLLDKDGYPAERFFLDKRFSQPATCITCQPDDESNVIVNFISSRGDFVPADKYFGEALQANSPWAGFVPNPQGKRQFFFSIPNLNIIASLQDRFGHLGYNSVGLLGSEYPMEKPKNTYRILLCCDCRATECLAYPFTSDAHPVMHPTEVPFFAENLSLAPQVEHDLNLQAALDDNPLHYEFLNFARHGDLLFWPNVEVPREVKKLDVDLVIILSPNLDWQAYEYYYLYNLTPDGVPQSPPDPEYALKPALERIPDGLPRKFYDYCKAHNLVKIQGNKFVFDDKVLNDPKAQDMILQFWGKPWEVLNRQLSSMRTSGGKPVKLLILFTYMGHVSPEVYKPEFYEEVARKYDIPYFDMNPDMNALQLSYYPLGDGSHTNPDGAVFFGKLLSNVLPREGLIPWPTPDKTPAP